QTGGHLRGDVALCRFGAGLVECLVDPRGFFERSGRGHDVLLVLLPARDGRTNDGFFHAGARSVADVTLHLRIDTAQRGRVVEQASGSATNTAFAFLECTLRVGAELR